MADNDTPDPNTDGYVIPDLGPQSEGYVIPDLPDVPSDGYVVPDLSQSSVNQSAQQASGAVSESNGRFVMKDLENDYLQGEKNAASRIATVGGHEVEVRSKEWYRDQLEGNVTRFEQTIAEDQQKLAEMKVQGAPRDEIKAAEKAIQEKQEKVAPHREKVDNWEAWEQGEGGFSTQYLNAEQAAGRKVEITEDGQVVLPDAQQEGQKNIFVMDGEGTLYAKPDNQLGGRDQEGNVVETHHSSFLAGEAVAGAGEITTGNSTERAEGPVMPGEKPLEVSNEGQVKEVSDRSGHYKPRPEQTRQTMEHLQDQGVSLDNTKFTQDRGPTAEQKKTGMAKEYLQGQVTPEEAAKRGLDRQGLTEENNKVMEQTFNARRDVISSLNQQFEKQAEEKAADLDQAADSYNADIEQKADAPKIESPASPSQKATGQNTKGPVHYDQVAPVPSGYDMPPDLSQKADAPKVESPASPSQKAPGQGVNNPANQRQAAPVPSGYDQPPELGGNKPSVRDALNAKDKKGVEQGRKNTNKVSESFDTPEEAEKKEIKNGQKQSVGEALGRKPQHQVGQSQKSTAPKLK